MKKTPLIVKKKVLIKGKGRIKFDKQHNISIHSEDHIDYYLINPSIYKRDDILVNIYRLSENPNDQTEYIYFAIKSKLGNAWTKFPNQGDYVIMEEEETYIVLNILGDTFNNTRFISLKRIN